MMGMLWKRFQGWRWRNYVGVAYVKINESWEPEAWVCQKNDLEVYGLDTKTLPVRTQRPVREAYLDIGGFLRTYVASEELPLLLALTAGGVAGTAEGAVHTDVLREMAARGLC